MTINVPSSTSISTSPLSDSLPLLHEACRYDLVPPPSMVSYGAPIHQIAVAVHAVLLEPALHHSLTSSIVRGNFSFSNLSSLPSASLIVSNIVIVTGFHRYVQNPSASLRIIVPLPTLPPLLLVLVLWADPFFESQRLHVGAVAPYFWHLFHLLSRLQLWLGFISSKTYQ